MGITGGEDFRAAARLCGLLLWLSKPENGDDLLGAVGDAARRPLSPGEAGLVLNAIADGLESVLKAHDDEIDDLEAQLAVDGDEE